MADARVSRAYAVALALGLAALAAAASCVPSGVTGFAWRDGAGAALSFRLEGRAARGEEGALGPSRPSSRFIPDSLLRAEALEFDLLWTAGPERGAGSPVAEAGEAPPLSFAVTASASRDGSAPLAIASFPLLERRSRFVLNLPRGSSVASLGLSLAGAGEVRVEGIAAVVPFHGIERLERAGTLRVSSDFSLVLRGARRELGFDLEPPSPAPPSPAARGILLEYGPGQAASLIDIGTGAPRELRLAARRGGGSSFIGMDLLPGGASRAALDAPGDFAVRAFREAWLPLGEAELADLGAVLLSPDRGDASDFRLWRWDLLPSVIVLDFRDYSVQDSYLKRLAFFVEKSGFRGSLARNEDIAARHAWNAHDYRPEDLAAFFEAARKADFPLDPEEIALRVLLLERGVIVRKGAAFATGSGALISISRESPPYLRTLFLVHESMHAIFFADPDYRDLVRAEWKAMGSDEKWFWKAVFEWKTYDVSSDYLMANEYQAYLLQQPVAASGKYFGESLPSQLLERHPELKARVELYMRAWGGSFAARASRLEAWLAAKYGISAGRTWFLYRG